MCLRLPPRDTLHKPLPGWQLEPGGSRLFGEVRQPRRAENHGQRRVPPVNVTQRALSITQRALSVTQRALSVTQRSLSVTQRAL